MLLNFEFIATESCLQLSHFWIWVAYVCMSNPREVKEMTVTSTSSDQLCFAVPYLRWCIVICYNVDGWCFMDEYILFWWITAFVMWRMYVWTYWWSVCLGAHLQPRASASGRNLPNRLLQGLLEYSHRCFCAERNTSGTSCCFTSGKILCKGMNCALYLETAVL